MSTLKGFGFLFSIAIGASVSAQTVQGQNGGSSSVIGQSTVDVNTITTAVPFLLIAPDSRAGGMGEAGVSTSGDANSIHWNPAKMTFAEKDFGFGLSYSPWLRNLVPDISLMYVSGYKKIDETQAFGASLLYFTLGDIQFTDEQGNDLMQFRPNEYAIDLAYSRILSEKLSGGIALRFINSNLTGGQTVGGSQTKAGRSVAVDVSAYYLNKDLTVIEKDAEFAFGLNISNIGNRMAYSNSSRRDFIPINFRLGPSLTIDIDDYNRITITADVNKLLVPTTPVYATDDQGAPITNSNNEYVIASGQDPERAVASGMFGSFTDAPGVLETDSTGSLIQDSNGEYQVEKGSRFKEEMNEINYAIGMEYWYNKQFAVRAGYFWEAATKGNRKFFTLGAGIKYNVFGIDFAYLIPAYFGSAAVVNSPLKNTLRFSLTFDFEGLKSVAEPAASISE
ncbi:MAG: type IX secretion system outer membrane channel protein PorV [Flavobacteriales bacterium]|nr:type IX secretion system outer membrane channel protein PorV [Flavobacteriales bacterium]